jgi:hypothetical protein
MKTILSFSGGLDSIYVLWKELNETSNDVTAVFHLSGLITGEQMSLYSVKGVEPVEVLEQQWVAVQQMKSVIEENSRSFTLEKAIYDPKYINTINVQYNHGSVFRTAYAVENINAGLFDRYVTGHCRDNDGYTASLSSTWRPGTASSLSVEYFKQHASRGEIVFPLLAMNYSTANAIAELPQSLVDVQASYLGQTDPQTSYKYCIQVYAKTLLLEGKTPAQIYDIITEKSVIPGGMWRTQKRWLADVVPQYKTNLHVDWPMPDWGTSYKVPE